MMFTESVAKRIRKFILRMNDEERQFLEDKAKERGVHVTSLIRECIRKQLKPPTPGDAPETKA